MYDALWIGCSHSAGLYDIKNNIINSDNGIANRLAKLYRQDWKILSYPGEGNFTFMQIMRLLDENDLLKNFRNVFIQQTYEPRLNIYKQDAYNKMFHNTLKFMKKHNNVRNQTLNGTLMMHNERVFSAIARETYEAHSHRFNKEQNNFIDVCETIADSVDPRDPNQEYYAEWSKVGLDYMRMLSEKNGCNFYTFKWFGSYNTQPKTYPKKGLFKGEQDMFSIIREFNMQNYLSVPGSHPTEEILQFASKILFNELKEIGYK